MNMNMFEQFINPEFIFIPMSPLSIMMSYLLIYHKPKLLGNRMTTATTKFLKIFILNMTSQLTPKGQKWSPLLASLILLLLLSNLLSLLPYTFTPTSQLSTNMALALPLWLATLILGMKDKPSTTLAHLLPEGSPTPLVPFMVLIETASQLMRPIALGVRLTANITAGHLLMTMVSSTTINLINTFTFISLLTTILLFLLTLLELAVACIQAYVFVLLTILYLQENS
uniref:ATP synthase subunit a n=2 Tax=Sistrurus catenatus TaxID=8756 RepID=F2WUF2_9SAUR|nr:ATP synthase F0 subunit 6 [Sistrurus catenatus]ADZ48706.1 ATPase 6 [Sistrurus catenatus]WCO10282.1 ATP synthase F0 subunit 6 [Sistrurus catenatus]